MSAQGASKKNTDLGWKQTNIYSDNHNFEFKEKTCSPPSVYVYVRQLINASGLILAWFWLLLNVNACQTAHIKTELMQFTACKFAEGLGPGPAPTDWQKQAVAMSPRRTPTENLIITYRPTGCDAWRYCATGWLHPKMDLILNSKYTASTISLLHCIHKALLWINDVHRSESHSQSHKC